MEDELVAVNLTPRESNFQNIASTYNANRKVKSSYF